MVLGEEPWGADPVGQRRSCTEALARADDRARPGAAAPTDRHADRAGAPRPQARAPTAAPPARARSARTAQRRSWVTPATRNARPRSVRRPSASAHQDPAWALAPTARDRAGSRPVCAHSWTPHGRHQPVTALVPTTFTSSGPRSRVRGSPPVPWQHGPGAGRAGGGAERQPGEWRVAVAMATTYFCRAYMRRTPGSRWR